MNYFVQPGILIIALSFAGISARAQFKEIKAAPFSSAVARQKIHTLLENTNAANHDQTVATLSDWLKWYRDLLDEELIARWKGEDRGNLPLIMSPLADSRVAREVIEFSWRVDRPDTFTLPYAPMLGDLMERYPESGKPFLDDLLLPAPSGQPPVNLTRPEADTVCRILLDMPDIASWRKNALLILPRYRSSVDQLLKQDIAASGQENSAQEKMYRAMRWRVDLKLDPPTVSSQQLGTRSSRPAVIAQASPDAYSQRPHIVGPQSGVSGYTGPMSGTFESRGEPIPQNGECVFPNIPPVKLVLDFDTKHWEARLAPGEGQTQVLVLRNKGKGPQKRCVVHWTVAP